jgi:hypothetical protein
METNQSEMSPFLLVGVSSPDGRQAETQQVSNGFFSDEEIKLVGHFRPSASAMTANRPLIAMNT